MPVITINNRFPTARDRDGGLSVIVVYITYVLSSVIGRNGVYNVVAVLI
jgi:hypothetical protein